MASQKLAYELKIRCKYCDRFLNVKAIESSHMTVRCPDRKCKMDNEIKIVMLSDHINEDHTDCSNGCKHDHSELKVMPAQPTVENLAELKARMLELDRRTKDAKKLQAQIDDMEKYITSLEGIVDGQG